MVAALAYQQMRDAIGPKPRGFAAIGVFLFFGAVMASLAATTLLWRGTALDRLWTLNPTAYKQLGPYRRDSLLGAQRGPHHGRNRMVSTPPLGMETSDRNHFDSGSRGCR